MFEPIILPNNKSYSFLITATTEVANSGKEVPKATIVIDITILLTPIASAILIALLINKSEPIIKRANDEKIIIIR